MPTPTYLLIASQTLSSAVNSVTLSSIDQTYNDLVFVVNGKVTGGNTSLVVRFNGDSSSSYSYAQIRGDGGTASASHNAHNELYPCRGSFQTVNTSSCRMEIMDYSNQYKNSFIFARGDTAATVSFDSARYTKNDVITSITAFTENPARLFAAGTTLKIFGIVG